MGMSFILLASFLTDCCSVLFRISSVFKIDNGFSDAVWQPIGEEEKDASLMIIVNILCCFQIANQVIFSMYSLELKIVKITKKS
jgi:hypothetical protein